MSEGTYGPEDVRRGSFALLQSLDLEPFWHKRVQCVLDAVAPSIAARAVRNAADSLWTAALLTPTGPVGDFARARDWLHALADEIEVKR